MGLGFELAESLSGSFYRLDDRSARSCRCACRFVSRVDGMRRFVRERVVAAEGVIVAEALALE